MKPAANARKIMEMMKVAREALGTEMTLGMAGIMRTAWAIPPIAVPMQMV